MEIKIILSSDVLSSVNYACMMKNLAWVLKTCVSSPRWYPGYSSAW
jgi:hypothetical protein